MAYPENLNIIIIGGSLAGLFTGVALRSLPNVASITILERYQIEQLQDLGAGIRLGDEACEALLQHTGQPPAKYAALLSCYRFISKDGTVSVEQTTNMWTSTWAQLYRILRQSFDADPKCRYRHGCTLENLDERDSSSLTVEFRDEHGRTGTTIADIVIGADGASSKVRSLMLPETTRTSAGYVCYRGVVLDSDVSEDAAKLYRNAGTFHWAPESQLVSYSVPSNEGPADESQRLINWVWYQNKTDDAMVDLLTDKQGSRHRFSLPAGGMSTREKAKITEKAREELPAAHAEIISKTAEPFAQVVTDSLAGSICFLGGKLLLVGDAVGGQRPHTASAMMQSAFHGLLVRELLQGHIDLDRWAHSTQGFSSLLVTDGKQLGQICMSDEPDHVKTPKYFRAFLGTQAKLKGLWEESIGKADVVL